MINLHLLLCTSWRRMGGVEVSLRKFLISVLDRGECSVSRNNRFAPQASSAPYRYCWTVGRVGPRGEPDVLTEKGQPCPVGIRTLFLVRATCVLFPTAATCTAVTAVRHLTRWGTMKHTPCIKQSNQPNSENLRWHNLSAWQSCCTQNIAHSVSVRQYWAPGSWVSEIERDESVSRWLSARMTCLSFHDIVILSGKHPSLSQIIRTEYPIPVDKNNLEWKLSSESWVAFKDNYASYRPNSTTNSLREYFT
jgi:hypothetical protein